MSAKKRRKGSGGLLERMMRGFGVDVFAVLAVLLGIFLLVEPFEIRESLRTGLGQMVEWAGEQEDNLRAFVAQQTLSDFIGMVFILLAVIFLAVRVRHHLHRSERLLAGNCPKCKGKVERIHRSRLDRVVGFVLQITFRRYRCTACGWSGLRRPRHRHSRGREWEGRVMPPQEFEDEPPREQAPDLTGEAS